MPLKESVFIRVLCSEEMAGDALHRLRRPGINTIRAIVAAQRTTREARCANTKTRCASLHGSAASRRTRAARIVARILVRDTFDSSLIPTRSHFMRRSGRAAIALFVTLCAASAHAQRDIHEGWLRVNAYDDRIDEPRAEQRRIDEHREEANREEAHREEAHREDARIEQQRLDEARRQARSAAYDAWLARWHESRTIEATSP
jgi:hypothetical protein